MNEEFDLRKKRISGYKDFLYREEDVKEFIRLIEEKVLLHWKGQNEFVDWLENKIGEKMNTIKTKINEVEKEIEENRKKLQNVDLEKLNMEEFMKINSYFDIILKKKKIETLKFCQAEMENEKAIIIEKVQMYFDSCLLLKKVPKFAELKSRIEKEKN